MWLACSRPTSRSRRGWLACVAGHVAMCSGRPSPSLSPAAAQNAAPVSPTYTMITPSTSFAADFLLPNGKCYGVTTELRRIIFDFAWIATPADAFNYLCVHHKADLAWFHYVTESYAHLQLGTVAEQRARARVRWLRLCNCRICPSSRWSCDICPKHDVRTHGTSSDVHALLHSPCRPADLARLIASTTRIKWGTDRVIKEIWPRRCCVNFDVPYILLARMCAETPRDDLDDVCKRETGQTWIELLAGMYHSTAAKLLNVREYSVRERFEVLELRLLRYTNNEVSWDYLRLPGGSMREHKQYAGCFGLATFDPSKMAEWGMVLQLVLYSETDRSSILGKHVNRAYQVARRVRYPPNTLSRLLASVLQVETPAANSHNISLASKPITARELSRAAELKQQQQRERQQAGHVATDHSAQPLAHAERCARLSNIHDDYTADLLRG